MRHHIRSTLVAAGLLVSVALPTTAATQRVDFTMVGPSSATATGFITYDDVVVAADNNVVGPSGNCSSLGSTDNSIDYEITFSGGAADGVTFTKADCTGVAFCEAPNFSNDVNFFGCSAGGFTGTGVAPNTFEVLGGSGGALYTFDSLSAPTPAAPTTAAPPRPVPVLPLFGLLGLGGLVGLLGMRKLKK